MQLFLPCLKREADSQTQPPSISKKGQEEYGCFWIVCYCEFFSARFDLSVADTCSNPIPPTSDSFWSWSSRGGNLLKERKSVGNVGSARKSLALQRQGGLGCQITFSEYPSPGFSKQWLEALCKLAMQSRRVVSCRLYKFPVAEKFLESRHPELLVDGAGSFLKASFPQA